MHWRASAFIAFILSLLGTGYYLNSRSGAVDPIVGQGPQKIIRQFKDRPYYELNMESEVPLTSGCQVLDDLTLEKYQSYNCTESDDKVLSDWSCVKPTMSDSPSREFVEIIQGTLADCHKKLEDFRDRFQ